MFDLSTAVDELVDGTRHGGTGRQGPTPLARAALHRLDEGDVAIYALAAIAAVLAFRPAAPWSPADTAAHEPAADAADSGSNTVDITATYADRQQPRTRP